MTDTPNGNGFSKREREIDFRLGSIEDWRDHHMDVTHKELDKTTKELQLEAAKDRVKLSLLVGAAVFAGNILIEVIKARFVQGG